MSKVSFANLKLKVNNSCSKFTFNDTEIEVLNYLPIEDKYDLVMVTLQKAREGSVFNPIKLDIFFYLNLIYMYTNLSFTDKQKDDETRLFDLLQSNGLMDAFLAALSEDEFNYLYDMLNNCVKRFTEAYNSASAMIQSIIQDLPKNAEAASKIVDNFDKEKYKEVIKFAQAANGGRPI